MTVPFRERLIFDASGGTLHDEARRYMMIRPAALMGIFRRLPTDARTEALAALQASIFEQGSDSAQAYVAHAGTAEGLMTIIPATAADLGWGRWNLTRAGESLLLEVADSPFADGYGPSEGPICHAITGMLQGVAGILTGRPARAREIECAAMGAAQCRFHTDPEGQA
jgi:predicted hydrocarbon binding protein